MSSFSFAALAPFLFPRGLLASFQTLRPYVVLLENFTIRFLSGKSHRRSLVDSGRKDTSRYARVKVEKGHSPVSLHRSTSDFVMMNIKRFGYSIRK